MTEFLTVECPVCRQNVRAYRVRVGGVSSVPKVMEHYRPDGLIVTYLKRLWPWSSQTKCAGAGKGVA